MNRIFVSYRRKDSASETGRIVEYLDTAFGKKAVFNDVFDIEAGKRFAEVIEEQLRGARVMLVIIGNQWLNSSDENGNRRLDDPHDYVRNEIRIGLSLPKCVVIPVLINNQSIPSRVSLPEAIVELVDRNAAVVRPDPDFSRDMKQLCQLIGQYVPAKRVWPKYAAAILMGLVTLVTAFALGPGHKSPDTIVEAMDSLTGEQILQPFHLKLEGLDESDESTSHLIRNVRPNDLSIESVSCRGYESEVSALRELERTTDGYQLRLMLKRTDRFDKDIQPNIDHVEHLPDDRLKEAELQDNLVPPENVELLVHNTSKQHINVIIYWDPPSSVSKDELLAERPFASVWGHINGGRPIAPGETVSFSEFSFPNGYYLIFVSVNGLEANLLGGAALYKAPFALLEIANPSIYRSPIYSQARPNTL